MKSYQGQYNSTTHGRLIQRVKDQDQCYFRPKKKKQLQLPFLYWRLIMLDLISSFLLWMKKSIELKSFIIWFRHISLTKHPKYITNIETKSHAVGTSSEYFKQIRLDHSPMMAKVNISNCERSNIFFLINATTDWQLI